MALSVRPKTDCSVDIMSFYQFNHVFSENCPVLTRVSHSKKNIYSSPQLTGLKSVKKNELSYFSCCRGSSFQPF